MIRLKTILILGCSLLIGCQQDNYTAGMAKVKQAVTTGNYAQAAIILEEIQPYVREIDPRERKNFYSQQYEVYKRLSVKQAKDGDLVGATATLEKLVALFPDAAEAVCLLAQGYLENHDLEKGGVALSRCLAAAERDKAPELGEFVAALQSEYKQQSLLADGRLIALVELATNFPQSASGQSAAKRLPSLLLQALQKPEEIGPPHNGNAEPFTMFFRLLTTRYSESPEAAVAIEHYSDYQNLYNVKYAVELEEFKRFHDYQMGHSFCKQMELHYLNMRHISLEIGMQVDIWLKENSMRRMYAEDRVRLMREYSKNMVATKRDPLLELRAGIKSAKAATSQQKWVGDRMNTAINGLVTLQRVTDEYLMTQNERAKQQRNNISSWLDFFILQLNLDIQWVCPDTDALPPTVNKEPI